MHKVFVLEVEINKKKERFYNAYLNSDEFIEFEDSTVDFGEEEVNIVYYKGKIYVKNSKGTMHLELEDEESKKVEEYRDSIIKDLSTLYQDIVNGKEKIMLLPINGNSKYLATTDKVLANRRISIKYNSALEFCFSDKMLKTLNLRELGLKTNSDIQESINSVMNNLDVKVDYSGIASIEYSKLIKTIQSTKIAA